MSRTIIGSVVAGVVMFVLGWIFFASPLYPMMTGTAMTEDQPQMMTMIMGLIQLIVSAWALAMLLSVVSAGARSQVLLWAPAMAMIFTYLGDPIWEGADWRVSIYSAVTGFIMLWVAGFVIMRWFMPANAS